MIVRGPRLVVWKLRSIYRHSWSREAAPLNRDRKPSSAKNRSGGFEGIDWRPVALLCGQRRTDHIK